MLSEEDNQTGSGSKSHKEIGYLNMEKQVKEIAVKSLMRSWEKNNCSGK